MTTKNNTSNLIDLKLAVINYHDGENMDYLRQSIARDACYTSFNSLTWKKKQIADAISDFETAVAEGRDSIQMRIVTKIEGMEAELTELEDRHEADKAVYFIISEGQEWMPERKSKGPVLKASALDALKKRVA